MSLLDAFYRKKSQYIALRSNVQSIISFLNSSNQHCADLSVVLKERYIVNNDPTPLVQKTSALSNDIDETSNYLQKSVIPGIDNAIKGVENAIRQLEAEERAMQATIPKSRFGRNSR